MSTARFTSLVVGAVAVTLVLAAAISAAMNIDNFLPAVARQVAVRAPLGGEPQPGSQDGAPPAVPAPQPTAAVDQDEPELEPGDDGRDGDRHGGGDGGDHGSGRDGGRG